MYNENEINQIHELYKIEYGSQAWYYTASDTPKFYENKTYSPAFIKRGSLNKTTNLESMDLEITVAINEPILTYVNSLPIGKMIVTIGNLNNDNAYLETYKGIVTNITLQDSNLAVVLLSDTIETTTKLPRYSITPACNNYLFDARCGLNINQYKRTRTIKSISHDGLTLTFQISTEGSFKDGYCQYNNEIRLITGCTSTSISINEPFLDIQSGSLVECIPGCNKSYEMCRDKYRNTNNFFGFRFVPRKNPVMMGFV